MSRDGAETAEEEEAGPAGAAGAPVIVVDDEEDIRLALEQALEIRGFDVSTYARADRALAQAGRDFPGVVVSDIRMPRMDGLAFLAAVREADPDLPVILVTGHGDVPLAVEALRAGAYDFIEKPFAPERLTEAVARAAEKRRLVMENRALREEARGGGDGLEGVILGRSPAAGALRERLRAAARSGLDVLITGETGTGKDLAARALHDISARAARPFVTVNLAALPLENIEAELFGQAAHAVPGAPRGRTGRFEHARGGTLFLDEIGAAPLPLQVKLLRVLEDRAIAPLGAPDPVPLDVRFVAATKEDLGALVAAGRFRDDLLYRLNPVTLRLPPLRDRLEDAPRLFRHFVDAAARRLGREAPPIPPETLLEIAAHGWPGNIRELRHAAERLAAGMGAGLDAGGAGGGTPTPGTRSLADQVEAYEKGVIAAALAAHGGGLKAVYESLGTSRKTLYEKMQRHGLRREDFASETGGGARGDGG